MPLGHVYGVTYWLFMPLITLLDTKEKNKRGQSLKPGNFSWVRFAIKHTDFYT